MSSANGRPTITAEDAEEFTASLGQFVSGSYRQIALAQRMGIPQALGLTTEEWVEQRLGGYIRMAIPERREAVKELADEGMSQRAIAAVVGVDQSTVSDDVRAVDGKPSRKRRNPDTNAANTDPDDGIPSPGAVRSEESPPYDAAPDHPVGAVVDLDTGEAVEPDPEPIDFTDAAYRVADDAAKARMDRMGYVTALSRSMERVNALLEYDPERVAAVIDPEFKQRHIDTMVERVADWARRVERAMPDGLRVVKGGRG